MTWAAVGDIHVAIGLAGSSAAAWFGTEGAVGTLLHNWWWGAEPSQRQQPDRDNQHAPDFIDGDDKTIRSHWCVVCVWGGGGGGRGVPTCLADVLTDLLPLPHLYV